MPFPTRMPDDPSKMPGGGKANSKLLQSALSPGQFWFIATVMADYYKTLLHLMTDRYLFYA